MKKLAILSVIMLMLLLAGCSEKPDKVVNKYLAALKSGELAKADNMTDISLFASYSANEADLTKAILSKIDYKNVKLKESSAKEAVVTVEISTLDTVRIVSDFVMAALQGELGGDLDNITDEKMDAALMERFKAADAPRKTSTVDITLVKDGKAWRIQANEDLQSGLFGVDKQEEMPAEDDGMQYEIKEEKTVSATFVSGDKMAGICTFKVDAANIDMYCDDTQYDSLQKDFLGKSVKITYQMLQTADAADTVFVLVDIVKN